MAKASGLTQNAIVRIWREFGLKPHLKENFKLSTDPFFVEKIRDIVGSTSIRRKRPARWWWASTRRARFRCRIAVSPSSTRSKLFAHESIAQDI